MILVLKEKQLIILDRDSVLLNTISKCLSLLRRFVICWMNSKRQGKAGCAPGTPCSGSAWFEVGNVAIPAPTQKTFEAEGEILGR